MEIFVDEYAISPRRFIAGTKGSYGFCSLNFKFSSEWNGLAKKITFYPLDGSGAVYLIISGDEVKIPVEVMSCAGVSKYVISGWKDGNVLISVTGEIDVLNSLSPDGEPAEEPTPSQMEQVMNMMQTAVDTAQSIRNDADNGVFKGDKGDVGEKGDTGEKGPKGDKGDPGEVTLEYAHGVFSNTLKRTASGEAVAISDASPVEHTMDVRVKSKNILPYPFLSSNSLTTQGITFTLNEDRSITISGVATGNAYYLLWNADLGSKNMTGSANGGTNGDYAFSPFVNYNAGNKNVSVYVAKGTDLTIPVTIYPQIEKGTAVTDYTPYIAIFDSVRVTVSGDEDFSAYRADEDGAVYGVISKYPSMTLYTNVDGVIIECTYNRDINKAFEELYNAIISLGGNV